MESSPVNASLLGCRPSGTGRPLDVPADPSEHERPLVEACPTSPPEDTAQREHPPRKTLAGLRQVAKPGAPLRWMPDDLSSSMRRYGLLL